MMAHHSFFLFIFLFYYFLSNIVTLSQHHAAKITPALPHCLLMFIEILKVLIPYCHFLGFAEVYLKKKQKKTSGYSELQLNP